MTFDLVCLGELLIDFTRLNPDSSSNTIFQANPGGAPANVACTAQNFGLETTFIGCVGEDMFGKLLVDTLDSFCVDTKGIIYTPNAFTTLAFVDLDQYGDREFSFSRKPGADTLLNLNNHHYEMLLSSSVLHFGTLSLTDNPAKEATYTAVQTMNSHNKLVSFDPNVRETCGKISLL